MVFDRLWAEAAGNAVDAVSKDVEEVEARQATVLACHAREDHEESPGAARAHCQSRSDGGVEEAGGLRDLASCHPGTRAASRLIGMQDAPVTAAVVVKTWCLVEEEEDIDPPHGGGCWSRGL